MGAYAQSGAARDANGNQPEVRFGTIGSHMPRGEMLREITRLSRDLGVRPRTDDRSSNEDLDDEVRRLRRQGPGASRPRSGRVIVL